MSTLREAIQKITSDSQLTELRKQSAKVLNFKTPTPDSEAIVKHGTAVVKYLFDTHLESVKRICTQQVKLSGKRCANSEETFTLGVPRHKKFYRLFISQILMNEPIQTEPKCEFVGEINVNPMLYMNPFTKKLDLDKLYEINSTNDHQRSNITINWYGRNPHKKMSWSQCAFTRLCTAETTNGNYLNPIADMNSKVFSRIKNVRDEPFEMFFDKVTSLDPSNPLMEFIVQKLNSGDLSDMYLKNNDSETSGAINQYTKVSSIHTAESVKTSFDKQQQFNRELSGKNQMVDSICIRAVTSGIQLPKVKNGSQNSTYSTPLGHRLAACIHPDSTMEEMIADFKTIIGMFSIPKQNFQEQVIFDSAGLPLPASKHNFSSIKVYAEVMAAWGGFSYKGSPSKMRQAIYVELALEFVDKLKLESDGNENDFTKPYEPIQGFASLEGTDNDCMLALEAAEQTENVVEKTTKNTDGENETESVSSQETVIVEDNDPRPPVSPKKRKIETVSPPHKKQKTPNSVQKLVRRKGQKEECNDVIANRNR